MKRYLFSVSDKLLAQLFAAFSGMYMEIMHKLLTPPMINSIGGANLDLKAMLSSSKFFLMDIRDF